MDVTTIALDKAKMVQTDDGAPGMPEEKVTPRAAITEDWLAEVGFKYREPGERQPFRHWTLTFAEQDDYGLYLETTMPGWLNASGDHIGADRGWFLWIGREHKFMHLRHVFEKSEIVALVEAITGQPWAPTRVGHVPMKRHQRSGDRTDTPAGTPVD